MPSVTAHYRTDPYIWVGSSSQIGSLRGQILPQEVVLAQPLPFRDGATVYIRKSLESRRGKQGIIEGDGQVVYPPADYRNAGLPMGATMFFFVSFPDAEELYTYPKAWLSLTPIKSFGSWAKKEGK